MQAVAEAWRNLTAVGARPLAVTDNMNFGNPERPEIMGQFAAAIRGMAAACEALDFPVVSGNVSLYNETGERRGARHPADAGDRRPGRAGRRGAGGRPRAAAVARPRADRRDDGLARPVAVAARDRAAARTARRRRSISRPSGATATSCAAQILAGTVRACHDVSDGGLLVAMAEMAMAGRIGVRLSAGPRDIPGHAFWFGEDQGRYVLAVAGFGRRSARGRGGRRAGDARRHQRRAGFDTAGRGNHIGCSAARGARAIFSRLHGRDRLGHWACPVDAWRWRPTRSRR